MLTILLVQNIIIIICYNEIFNRAWYARWIFYQRLLIDWIFTFFFSRFVFQLDLYFKTTTYHNIQVVRFVGKSKPLIDSTDRL